MIGVVGQKWSTSGYHYISDLVTILQTILWVRDWAHLVHHILKRNGTVNGKADKEEICFWV